MQPPLLYRLDKTKKPNLWIHSHWEKDAGPYNLDKNTLKWIQNVSRISI